MRLDRRLRWVAATAILALAPVPREAAAISLFGFTFFEGEQEPPPEGAVAYEVEFDVFGEDRALRRRLIAASALEDESGEPSPGAGALISRARGDYQRLLAALYAEGRYGGTISILVDGSEASGLPLDADLGAETTVFVQIDPGPEYRFGDIAIADRPPVPQNDDEIPQTPEELGLVPGSVARSGVVVASDASLVGTWRENGYPKARIEDRRVTARHDADAVDVATDVDPGRYAVFGATTVTGTEDMDPGFVAWYAGITPGEPFDPDDIARARDQLRRLEVFQAQRINELDIGDDGSMPIGIVVAERPKRVFGAGAKYSTLDGAQLETYWRHRNLFGRAEKLNLEARVGGLGAQDPSEYNFRVAATFIKPGVITPYTDLVATAFGEQLRPTTFRARTAGGRIGLQHRVYDYLTLDGFLSGEYSQIDETKFGDGDFVFLSTPVSATYDASNDELDPTRGYRLTGKLEPFYEVTRDHIGLISELGGSTYYGVADDRVVFAGRLNVGSIVGAPLDDIPANRLFLAGGGGSIRGYAFKSVGPEDRFGDTFGGRSYFTGAAEARIRVTDSIGVVPFFDFGNAFEDSYPSFEGGLQYAAGLGLRYKTGLGPIRLDVAVPLNPEDGDDAFAFYIGLGQAF